MDKVNALMIEHIAKITNSTEFGKAILSQVQRFENEGAEVLNISLSRQKDVAIALSLLIKRYVNAFLI